MGLMMPGVALGAGFAGVLAAYGLGGFFEDTSAWVLLLAAAGNIVLALSCLIVPLWVLAKAEQGRPRRSRRLMTGVAVALAYLLPTIYLILFAQSL